MRDHSSGPPPEHDALSTVLQDLRLIDGSYGRCELTAPWGIRFPPQKQARFHLVVSGECMLRDPRGRWRALRTGDVLLLPHGTEHAIASKANGRMKDLEAMPLDEVGDRTYRMRAGGAGANTVLVCCSVTFAQAGMQPLLEMMPPLILLQGAATEDATLKAVLHAMEEEVLRQRMGYATIMARLADVLVARVIRDWVESRREDTTGWLAAIRDERVGRAIAAIHKNPGDAWSVASLARTAGASRSVFAERFTSVVGISPARYLAQWRMHVASEWLRADRITVAEAATKLGYDSEAAFSRAFKRFAGRPPSAVRLGGV